MGEDSKPKAQLIKHASPKTEPVVEKKKVVVKRKKKVVVKKSDSPKKTVESANTETPATKSVETKVPSEKKEEKNFIPPSVREQGGRGRTGGAGYRQDSQDRYKPRRNEGDYNNRGPRNDSRPRSGGYDNRRDGNREQGDYRRSSSYNNRNNDNRNYDNRNNDNRNSRFNNRDNSGQGSRGNSNYRGGSRPGGNDRFSNNRSSGNRPGGGYRPGGNDRGNFRSNGPGGNRSGGPGRPGGYRPGGPGRPSGPGRPGGSGRPGGPGRPGTGNRPGGAPESSTTDGKGQQKRFYKAKKKKLPDKKDKNREINFQLPSKRKKNTTNPVPKKIDIMEVITVSDLAKKMNLKASDLISKLMGMGMMVTINQQIDSDTASILAEEFGCSVNVVSLYDETLIEGDKIAEEHFVDKAPVVTVMGHVDHGKTKLLDAIRETDVVAGEHGGITQHIGAYKVKVHDEQEVVFLDTPGHAAFTLMRARGAQVTDIVILIVAANDGVMPQTKEAVSHAKEAGVPIIVAVNKMDLPEANPDRVKQQLSELGLMPEDWGGDTIFCPISALKKQGIKELLDSVLLQAEMLELKAPVDARAEGKIIEARVDHGRGIVASVLIEKGTLQVGDPFVAGVYSGKVRALFNDRGKKIKTAGPATPVEILGFSGVPSAGSPFQVTESEKEAKNVSEKRIELEKYGESKNLKKITLDNFYDSIQDGDVQELKVIVKGDVVGSVEAIKSALEKLSTSEIRLNVIHASVGAVVENDVTLADASNAIIIAFHVRPTPKAQDLADRSKVDIRKYHIIYDIVDDMTAAMEGLLEPDYNEVTIGTVEVRDTFKVPKIGVIAGCYVTSGVVKRNCRVHLFRDDIEIFHGAISSLKRFKDDAKEVREGFECGIGLQDCQDIKSGDSMEIYEMQEVKKKLTKTEVHQ